MSLENDKDKEKVVTGSDINQELRNLNIKDIINQAHDVEEGTDVQADKEEKEENALPDDLKCCTVSELKEKLRKKKLPVTGNKQDLIKRLLGLEAVADSEEQTSPQTNPTEHDLRKHNVTELKEMLREKKMRLKGNKSDLIDRLLGKEVPMPKEKWEDSKDKAFLGNLLKDTSPSSVQFQTAEEISAREPFKRWPPVYFIKYFEKARSFVLRSERIVSDDSRDFLTDIEANPRNDLTRRGESPVCSSNTYL